MNSPMRRRSWYSAHRAWLFAAVFIFGAGIRAIDLWRPVDGRIRESWRESDEAAIARNFTREGMNILYPRVDWRGDGPGYAEMEFPLFPWTIAVLYDTFGFHEVLGRVLAYTFALATLAIFLALARRLLPWRGALAAGLFFALNPLIVRISNALQPEALMLLAYIAGVYAFVRWLDARRPGHRADGWWMAAALATSIAILAKATAAHVGVLFAVLLWRRYRWTAARDPWVWAFGVIALVPSALWYSHAHHLWITYGNSLGLSNEDHWIGADVFRESSFTLGLITAELFYVWTAAGALTGLYGLAAAPNAPAARVAVPWLAGAMLFYVAAIRTTANSWALYYHIFSVAPVALLFGLGVAQLARLRWRPATRAAIAVAMIPCAIVLWYIVAHDLPIGYSSSRGVKLGAIALVVGFMTLLVVRGRGQTSSLKRAPGLAITAGVAAPLALLLLGAQVAADVHPHHETGNFIAAKLFAPSIPPGALILSSGGPCHTVMATHVAYNQSYMFYWLDRKGFDVCVEQQSMARLDSVVQRGARYFVANDTLVHSQPGFADSLDRRFPILATSNGWSLYALRPADNGEHGH
jgi:4-amino-4-deoxy-L-arabinose transferase-like glycosyltransferase